MAFVLPTFNITADVFDWTITGPAATPRITVDCQLRAPSMQNTALIANNVNQQQGAILLVAPGTDLRDNHTSPGNHPDYVEVPAGSGRLYVICVVDDVGKGFPNEHRYAVLAKAGFAWPIPMP